MGMSILIPPYAITKRIKAIEFRVLDPDTIRKMAVVEIITDKLYDASGMPLKSGLMDRRLGPREPGVRCEICGHTIDKCPGHFGKIELAKPVIHVCFVKVIHELLRATCRNCGRILLSDDEIRDYKAKLEKYEKRWKALKEKIIDEIKRKAMERTQCPHCRRRHYKIKLEKPYTFYEEREEGPVRLTPEDIREWLEKIPNEDLELLGYNPKCMRPEWLVLTVLPVPPIVVRPSIVLEEGKRSEDDLTHKLVDIVRTNNRLREDIESGAPQNVIDQTWDLLQYHVATYFDNELSGIRPAQHRTGKPIKGLAQRLKGKEGRFRGNLSGKRVDFSARTVISPDPYLSINEVGIPVEIAKQLTIPERVTLWNIDKLKKLIENGPQNYPGAIHIIKPDGTKIRLDSPEVRRYWIKRIEPGFIVERHLLDGDIVLFNRQPSLHRMSMMGHKVKVLPYRTFRLNLPVCPPYNADFDGDEMNLHVPQSREAQAEARILLLVQEHILTPRYGGPLIGFRHDYITSAFILTSKKTLLTREEAAQLLMQANIKDLPEPAILHPVELWTGKQIFSALLPKDIYYEKKAKGLCMGCTKCVKWDCPYDAYILVFNGELLSGALDKSAMGAEEPESLLHRITRNYGTDFAREFIDGCGKMLLYFLDRHGFTMSSSNLDMPERVRHEVQDLIKNARNKIDELIRLYKEGKLEEEPGKTLKETLEDQIHDILDKVLTTSSNIVKKYVNFRNEAYIMTITKARGNPTNMTQMAILLGQQSLRGKRIRRGYTFRTLPHFKWHDMGPEAHGFITGSFKTGLKPTEFFFHAISGREGLVDTAVRTSQSGYMQRRLINALQDLHVAYDNTVRSSENYIIQLRYGEDAVDPSKAYHGKPVDVESIMVKVLGEKYVEGKE